MSGILVALVVLSVLGESSAQTRCSNGVSSFGIGDIECVLLTPYYSEYQWATCLTDEYIRRVSEQNHACRGGAAICWYQCQVELNSLAEGPVYDNCRCSNAGTLPTPDQEMPTLAPECYSPGGLDCSWYRQCLEARYPCEGTEDGYAIEYAERYCNLYTDNYNDFSQAGRLWIDGVRKCLQLVLVPSLRPWVRKTCADVSNDAFGSHADCYINPANMAPSICNLPCLDTWKAFWIVNGVGGALLSAPAQTATQMIDVILGCYGNLGCTRVGLQTLLLAIPGLRAVPSAIRVGQYIAQYFNFEDNRIGWFPYFEPPDNNSPDTDDSIGRQRRSAMAPQTNNAGNIMLLLVDLQLLNVSNGTSAPTNNPGRQTLEEIITAIGDTVNNGGLSRIPVVLNDTEFFGVSSVGQCDNTLCRNETNVTYLATAPVPTVAVSTSASGTLRLTASPMWLFLFTLLHAADSVFL